jgi:hypothetical protein
MLTEDAEVMERLNRLARLIGRIFSVTLGVDVSGDRLVFVDEGDESIMADGQEIIAATAHEIADKRHLDDFAVRAFRAALIYKNQEMERTRTP